MIKNFNDFNNLINERKHYDYEFNMCCILVKLDGVVEKVYCCDAIDTANSKASDIVKCLKLINNDNDVFESNEFRGNGIRYYAKDIDCLNSENRIIRCKSCEILSFRSDDFYEDLELISLKLNNRRIKGDA
jgi:hypothetical protein